MKGVGVNNNGRKTTSPTNVIDFFCTPITTRGGGNEIGAEDGGGKGHEDGMVRMTLPLGTCEDTRGTT
jgi:hypothetical protein